MQRDNTARKLVAVERARKLLNLAYDKRANVHERENALRMAGEVLKPHGLTVEDLKKEATPDYLTKPQTGAKVYDPKRAGHMASALSRGGWTPIDPRSESYKDYEDKT